jgi:hypothetical protein
LSLSYRVNEIYSWLGFPMRQCDGENSWQLEKTADCNNAVGWWHSCCTSLQVPTRWEHLWEIGAEMQLRNRNLSESRQAFRAPRIYKKRESNAFAEAMRFSPSSNRVGGRPLDPISDSDLLAAGSDHPEVRFNDEEGLVLFDRSAEHHLYVPFLDMLLRQYQQRPESRATVREWVRLRNSESPLGFESLCNYLDLEPDYFRDGLTRWLNRVDRGADANRARSNAAFSS